LKLLKTDNYGNKRNIRRGLSQTDQTNLKEGHYFVIEQAMKEYAKLKCQELLEIVVDNAMIETNNDCYGKKVVKSTSFTEREQGFSSTTFISVDKDSIFNSVDLDSFCS